MTAKRRSPQKSGTGRARAAGRKRTGSERRARTRASGTAPERSKVAPEDVEAARRFVSRAIRRLNVLETVIMGAAVIIALLGGWLGALLAHNALGLPLRTTWMVLSVLLFVVPAALAWTMDRRKRREERKQADADARDNRGGGHDG